MIFEFFDYEENELFGDYAHRRELLRLELFGVHLSNIGRLFEQDDARVRQENTDTLGELEEALGRNEEFFWKGEGDWMSESQILMHHEIPELTMNSISSDYYKYHFVSLYAEFEKSLEYFCEELPRPLERLSVRDMRHRGIERSKIYLVKVLNVDEKFFGTNKNWTKICKYRELRNSLVHPANKMAFINEKGIIEFVQNEQDYSKILERQARGETTKSLVVNEDFCFNAINVMGNFWLSLFNELSKRIEI